MIEKNLHNTILAIDPKVTMSEMKQNNSLFWKNSRKSEKKFVHRGCLIVVDIQDFTGSPNTPVIHVYAYNTATCDLLSINQQLAQMFDGQPLISLEDAKDALNKWLDLPELKPLIKQVVEVDLTIPVKVNMAVFKNQDGQIVGTQFAGWVKVGSREVVDPVECFFTEVHTHTDSLARSKAI